MWSFDSVIVFFVSGLVSDNGSCSQLGADVNSNLRVLWEERQMCLRDTRNDGDVPDALGPWMFQPIMSCLQL